MLVATGLLSLVLMAYLYGYWMPSHLKESERDLREANQLHLASVAESLVPLLLSRQLDAIYENLDALRNRNRDWVLIQLSDKQKRVLYPLSPSAAMLIEEQDMAVLQQPLQITDTELGLLTVKVDMRGKLAELRTRHLQLEIASVIIIFLYIAIIWFILERGVRRPLLGISAASTRLAEGDFDAPLYRQGSGEVTTLVNSFESMRSSIRGYQAELEKKNDSLTTLLHAVQQSPIAIVIVDISRRIQFVNPRFCELTGYTPGEAQGMECYVMGGGMPSAESACRPLARCR